jgi:hypothetical protein
MSGELINFELQKFDDLYSIAEAYVRRRGNKTFNLATIGELIALLSTNLSQFRDEQKTAAIVSVLRRLYKGPLIQEKLSNLSVARQEKLTNFINNALPYYVDMSEEFVTPFNLFNIVNRWWNYLLERCRFSKNSKKNDSVLPDSVVPAPVDEINNINLNIKNELHAPDVKTNTFRDVVRETVVGANP